jgi:hypothetical protein
MNRTKVKTLGEIKKILMKNNSNPRKKGFLEMENKPLVMSSALFSLSTPIRHEFFIVICAKIIHKQLMNKIINPVICTEILLKKLKSPK